MRNCLNADVFVDTNIVRYAIDEDPASAAKRDLARKLLLSERWGGSVQLAAAFFVNAPSPQRPFRLSSTDAAAFVGTWLAYPTLPGTPDLVCDAMTIHQRFQLSSWDAAILAAAKRLGCHTVYCEDLNHGQDDDGVRVVNPFLVVAAAPPA